MKNELFVGNVGIRLVRAGEKYTGRCVNSDGHAFGAVAREAPCDGIVVVTPEGGEFLTLWAVKMLVDGRGRS